MNVPLDTLAEEINACHEKIAGYGKKAAEFRITRNQKIKEAHPRVGEETDFTWDQWVDDNLTISRRQTYNILQLEGPKSHNGNGEIVHQDDDVECGRDVSTGVMTDPIAYILTRVQGLTQHDTVRLLDKLVDQLRPLGISVSFAVM